MEKAHITIIGAGVAGLAIANRLSKDCDSVVLLERHDGFGREASSRNSEVIHAGFYYPSQSLKARFCVRGNALLYELCAKAGIAHRRIGKIVVATSPSDVAKLENLYKQGIENGVAGLEMLTKEQVAKKEPFVTALCGLYSGATGIIDTHGLMVFFEAQAMAQGVTIAYGCTVTRIRRQSGIYEIDVIDADGQPTTTGSDIVVNCAGCESGHVAEMAGISAASAGYTIHPCKGEYFSVNSRHKNKLNHLIYPSPTSISLGVHAVVKLDGGLKLGPNAFYVESPSDYDVDKGHQEGFFVSASKYLPFLVPDDLSPDMAGIRPKLQAAGQGFCDFIIREESGKGLPNLVNLIGIESPGLTSSLAIAEYVADMTAAL